MKSFIFALPVVSLIMLINGSVLFAASYDLEASIKRGFSHNFDIQAKEILVQEAEKGIFIAQGNFLPSFSLSRQQTNIKNQDSSSELDSDYLNQSGVTLNFRAVQPLFAGFANLNSLAKARQLKIYRQVGLDEAKLILARDIRKEFVNHLKLNDLFDSVKGSEQRLLEQLHAANAFYEQRMVPRLHVLQIEVELSKIRQELLYVQTLTDNSRVSINQLLGFDLDRQVDYQGNLTDLSYEISKSLDEYHAAAQKRPSIRLAEINLDLSQKDAMLIMAKNMPKIDLDMNLYDQERDYDDESIAGYDRRYWSVGVNVTFPFFQGGRNIGAFQQQNLASKRYEKELNYLRHQVELHISTSYSLLLEAKKRIASTIEIKKVASETFLNSQTRYETGLGTIVDVLDSQEKISQADIDINQARTDFNIIKAELIYLCGQDELTLSGRGNLLAN